MSGLDDLHPALPVVIISAFVADLIIGDPLWMPHPVRWIGALISSLERFFMGRSVKPLYNLLAGAVLSVTVVGAVFFSSLLLLGWTRNISTVLYLIISCYMVWASVSVRSLAGAAQGVLDELKSGTLERAREKLSEIVGRDTERLSGDAVIRAIVETVSENTSDGIVAPLFYLAIGGPALSLAYRAVNTLDSMVGYKDDRYFYFGRFSARLDDLANYIPARITALFLVLSALVTGEDWRGALKILKRDGRASPSPNAGLPQAAAAGSLGIRLGGPAYYKGVLHKKPFMGDEKHKIDFTAIERTIRLMKVTALLAFGSALLFGFVF